MVKVISPEGKVQEVSEKAFRLIYKALGFLVKGEAVAADVEKVIQDVKPNSKAAADKKEGK
jgi:hypothetical protein